ncbi:ABC transporter permease subunit [methane-oxidizing endosymbiont of Gigantopelta aegis]|uniref:ABC transporter permease subunit n=1 Tax=methane-oxidizing endosymbiont of Gigantopelta aegis TaxID=2794938 RepID=UPI0018DB482F|nr:ABC transporter permease subunit [methane-oxidizing endosymbiont of Gigantopelta aegis]
MSEIIEKHMTEKQHPMASPGYQKWRLMKDKLAAYGVTGGGLGVIVAIVLIFFYLLYVVYPLFVAPSAEPVKTYSVPVVASGKTVFLSMEEQNEIGARFTDTGHIVFFRIADGQPIKEEHIPLAENQTITSFNHGRLDKGVFAYGLSDGSVIVVKTHYKVTYPDDVRLITPEIQFPLGKQPIQLDTQSNPLTLLTLRLGEDESTIVAATADGRLMLSHFIREESLFSDEGDFERTDTALDIDASQIAFMLLDKEQRDLYLANRQGDMMVFDLTDKTAPKFLDKQHVSNGGEITAMEFLNGELSVLIGNSKGLLSQWSLVKDEHNHRTFEQIRAFKVSDHPIVQISPEQRRKGVMVADNTGLVAIYHTTAERELIKQTLPAAISALSLSPRANAFIAQTIDGKIHFWHVDNEHPEVSWKSIWGKVWYESYPKPEYIWQSSSSSNDFEPKYSLTPLVFGTLKAAFYAMLLAVPLALMGAAYTAYFMAPEMRKLVKPTVEIMEALPTVILGFLAGLWLAPFVELHLLSIFSVFIVIPLAVLCFSWCWQYLPKSLRQSIPAGWEAAILIPVIILATWFAFIISPVFETWFFDGNIKMWMKANWGIGFDQRNALVVGIAMGFAVIPTIFSIAEDAIFSVPKHLTVGSLALGATPWQTMIRVVLLTASPGIFSAVMIGLGRAVGETMIVLMATGNTPVMDLSIFQGMRTLAANIAVEMPEAELDSTHYRVLFLAALVLFVFTFVFNTLAELVRQNLRNKYSSL